MGDKSIITKDKYIKDMTEGEPLILLFGFAIPLLIGNLFQQAYNVVDSIIVGRHVGKIALGAVGSTGSTIFFINSFTMGLSVGIGIIVAQYFGAKEAKKVKNSIGNGYYIVLITSIIMTFIGFIFAKNILNLLHTPNDTLPLAVLYLRTISIGFFPMAFFHVLASILRALGDSKTPLIFLVIACIINIFLDLVLVMRFNLGVMGVGIATIVSQFIAAFLCFIYANISNSYFRLEINDFNYSNEIFCKVLNVGIPFGGQKSLIAISLIALQRVVNEFGSDFVASFTIVARIEQLVQQPFMSLAAAMATYTGQNLGAGKEDRVKLGYFRAVLCISGFSFFIFLIFQTYSPILVGIFTKEQNVIKNAVTGLRVNSLFYIFLGFIHLTRSVLNGAGDAKFCFFNGILECIGRIGFAKPLTMIPIIGLNGVWATTCLTRFLNGFFYILRYRQGKWKTISMIKSNKVEIV